jgi:hypothetical protein
VKKQYALQENGGCTFLYFFLAPAPPCGGQAKERNNNKISVSIVAGEKLLTLPEFIF